MNKCRILFLAANPATTDRLALDEESRTIDEKVRAARHRDALELVTKWAVRPDDLLETLNRYRPHVVHFSGHGNDANEILLEDRDRNPKPVSAAALRRLFTALKDNIRVVVLNACYSRAQAEAIVEVIDCAIGMSDAIGDEAAQTFSASFYRAIGYGRSVHEAFEQGVTALMLQGIGEQHVPVLLVRAGVDARQIWLVESDAGEPELPADDTLKPPPPPPPPPPPQRTLLDVVPGQWQVEIRMAYNVGYMQLEVQPNGYFRATSNLPMGQLTIDGQWHVNVMTNQINLQGRQAMGYHAQPYASTLQVQYFDANRVNGFTPMYEQVSWQRVGMPPQPLS